MLPSIVPLQRQVQCADLKAESLVNNDNDAGHNSHGFSDSKDDASPSGHSWAWTRLQEHTWKELDAWKQGSEENRLKDALDALDAAFQALRLAEEICRDCLSSDVPNVARPSDRCQRVDFTVQQLPMPSPGESEQDAGFGHKSPAETENQSHGDSKVKESLPFHMDAESESERLTCQSTVGASRLSSELVQTDKAVQATVSGKLTVEGDVAIDASKLQGVLHSVLLQLGEVRDAKLVCTRPWQQSFLSGLTSLEGYRLFGSQDANGSFADGSLEFAFEVVACDPNDLEPLRETLLLEAECGGARHLLPMLAEQLCADDLPTPRHLKVRIEVCKE